MQVTLCHTTNAGPTALPMVGQAAGPRDGNMVAGPRAGKMVLVAGQRVLKMVAGPRGGKIGRRAGKKRLLGPEMERGRLGGGLGCV